MRTCVVPEHAQGGIGDTSNAMEEEEMPFDDTTLRTTTIIEEEEEKIIPGEIQLLMDARRLIAKRQHWCRNTLERESIFFGTQYCAAGALQAAANGTEVSPWKARSLLEAALPLGWRHGLMAYNDARTHKQILAVFDRAIAKGMPR